MQVVLYVDNTCSFVSRLFEMARIIGSMCNEKKKKKKSCDHDG